MNRERDIFRPYLERKYQQANAVTYGEKLRVIADLIHDVKQGIFPISPDQIVRLNSDSPPVVALRNGQAISLDGRTTTLIDGTGLPSRRQRQRSIVLALALLSVLPMMGLLWWISARGESAEIEAIATVQFSAEIIPTVDPTPIGEPQIIINTRQPEPTWTPQPTFTPVPITLESYAVDVNEPLAANQNPIALSFANRDFRVQTASLSAIWEPAGAEWWPGTHVRKVFAIPFEQSLLDNSFAQIGTPLHVRLRTGHSIAYRLDNVQRVNKLAVEYMLSTQPSVAIVLYDEPNSADSNQRWLITAIAEQDIGAGEVVSTSLIANSAETTPTYHPLESITIQSCHQHNSSAICTISAPKDIQLDNVYITEQSWLTTLDNIPPTAVISTTTSLSQTVTAQLAGVVRPNGQPVLAYATETGIQAQQLTFAVPETTNPTEGESE